ncbi:MAG TPA: hypothetical protein VL527_11820 [Dongiaceae bacterium]|nr:hypothetical protein [Dongiaceae bacterium]
MVKPHAGWGRDRMLDGMRKTAARAGLRAEESVMPIRLQQGDRCGVPEIGGASVLASRSRLSRNTGGQMGSQGFATVSASGSSALRKSAKSGPIKPDQTTFMPANRLTMHRPIPHSALTWAAGKSQITKRTQSFWSAIISDLTMEKRLTSIYAAKLIWVRLASFGGLGGDHGHPRPDGFCFIKHFAEY